jgi:predicted transcriptional regulator
VGPPTTVRLTPGLARSLDRIARETLVPRSEALRDLLTDALVHRALVAERDASIVSQAAGREHRVEIVVDIPGDDEPEAVKQRLAVRNQAVLTGQCGGCGACLEVEDEPPSPGPMVAVPSVSRPRPPAARTATAVKTKSPPRPVAKRATIAARFRHLPDCPSTTLETLP